MKHNWNIQSGIKCYTLDIEIRIYKDHTIIYKGEGREIGYLNGIYKDKGSTDLLKIYADIGQLLDNVW